MRRLVEGIRAHGAKAGSRGFALPLVLLLLFISSLHLAVAFERQTSQTRVVTRQLAEYRRHHEMFGIRALVTNWLKDKNSSAMTPYLEDEDKDFSYGFVLPSGAQVRIKVRDGQGMPGVIGSDAPEPQRVAYTEFLDRYFALTDAKGARRIVGPPEISLNTAPTVVLEALVPENGDKFAERVERVRRRNPIDLDGLENALRGVGLNPEESVGLRQIVTFTPVLWQLDINVRDSEGERFFEMLFEFDSLGAIELKWKEVTPLSDDEEETNSSPRRY